MRRLIDLLALGALTLALLSLAAPRWIEAVLGVEPDGGSGWLEALVPLVLAVAVTVLVVRLRLRLRRRHHWSGHARRRPGRIV